MFRFMRTRAHLSSEKIKDLFALTLSARHGFPHHPTSFAYDKELGLIALSTKKGELRLYGQPGVEYASDEEDHLESVVREIHFVGGKRGQLVILTDEGIIQLWQISTVEGSHRIEKVKSIDHFVRGVEGSSRHGITLCINSSNDQVLVGTTGGEVHTILLATFSVQEDAIVHWLPADAKKSHQGSVESIVENPIQADKFLIGYSRGLIVQWDKLSGSVDHCYNFTRQLESLYWLSNGQQFVSSHNDGSYLMWQVGSESTPVPPIPYGPFPCKPIRRIVCKTVQNAENLLVFTGGMPRSTYGDKMTVSIIQGDQDSGKHQVLDFTSKVIDFVVIDDPNDKSEYDNPLALIILLEEEIVAIDLRDPEWKQFKLPYLSSVHSSGITSCQYYADIPDDVFDEIVATGKKQDEGKFSNRDWPITGGVLPSPHQSSEDAVFRDDEDDDGEQSQQKQQEEKEEPDAGQVTGAEKKSDGSHDVEAASSPQEQEPAAVKVSSSTANDTIVTKSTTGVSAKTKDLLITGHEDGSILFWNASDSNLYHILSVNTRKYFVATDSDITPIDGDPDSPDDSDAVSEWPPFRKVGTFDPYSDDTRLAIRRLALCPMTGVLTAAGTAGQVIHFKLNNETVGEKVIAVHAANLVEETAGFVWKGHDQLHVKTSGIKKEAGFEPEFVIQVSPPAAVTALSLNTEWNIVSAGTAHGFVIFDLIQNRVILTKCTLNPADLLATAGGDALISRRKSFKKSLRESFRRLRRGRSTRTKKDSPEKTSDSPAAAAGSPIRSLASSDDADTGKPVERQIEARQDDGLGSMIRTISYAKANITSSGTAVPTVWVGTNAGTVLIYTLTLPEDEEKRSEEAVTIAIAKEIQLKHRAPVIYVQVIDSTGYPLPGPHEVALGKAKAPTTIGSQKVLIVSEEQFKLFTLPNLKPDRKSKLTAHEGSRARRISISQFTGSKINEITGSKVTEYCITCCSNQGDFSVYSITDLKRVQNHAVIKREDVHGIASVVLNTRGEGLYMHSPSELQRFSAAAHRIIAPEGWVVIPEGVRPVIAVAEEPAATSSEQEDRSKEAIKPAVTPVDETIQEETEEEVAAVSVPEVAPLARVEEAAVIHPVVPETGSEALANSSLISEQVVQKAAEQASTLLESALNDSDVPESDYPSLVEAVIEKASEDIVNNLLIPDLVSESVPPTVENGVNGSALSEETGVHKNGRNGHAAVDEEEEDSEAGPSSLVQNGSNGVSDVSANASSILTADITIDSVRDFTNLSLNDGPKSSEKEKKIKKPSTGPSSAGSPPAVEVEAGSGSGATKSSTPRKKSSNSGIPRSSSNRNAGSSSGGGSGNRRKSNRNSNSSNSAHSSNKRNSEQSTDAN